MFGSNEAGRHGAGAALFAKQRRGAAPGIGAGPSGQAYALPTKDCSLRTLPLGRIRDGAARFLDYAATHADHVFVLTRVGCGLAGYRDEQIAPMFDGASSNVLLPGVWRFLLRGERSIIVAGSRSVPDDISLPLIKRHLSIEPSCAAIVSGMAAGPDRAGLQVAQESGFAIQRFPAQWGVLPDYVAGKERNVEMAWAGSHLLAIWDGVSGGTEHMIQLARGGGLNVTVERIDVSPAPSQSAIGEVVERQGSLPF